MDTTNFEDALGSSEMMKETAYETKRAEVAIIQKKIDELKKEKEKIRKERDMLERNNPETINSVKSGVGERIRKEKKPKKDKKIKNERAEKEKNTDQNKNKKIKGPRDKIRKQMRRIETMELMEWGLSFKMPASTSSHIQEVILNIFIERMNCRMRGGECRSKNKITFLNLSACALLF